MSRSRKARAGRAGRKSHPMMGQPTLFDALKPANDTARAIVGTADGAGNSTPSSDEQRQIATTVNLRKYLCPNGTPIHASAHVDHGTVLVRLVNVNREKGRFAISETINVRLIVGEA